MSAPAERIRAALRYVEAGVQQRERDDAEAALDELVAENAELFSQGARFLDERDAARRENERLQRDLDGTTGALGEPCAECGHIDWRADPNGYLDRMEAAEARYYRLKRELDEWIFKRNAWVKHTERAEARCSRLEAALREIANRGTVSDAKGTWSKEVSRLAREALTDE